MGSGENRQCFRIQSGYWISHHLCQDVQRLAVILDMFSWSIVGWSISERITDNLTVRALLQVLMRKNCIFRSIRTLNPILSERPFHNPSSAVFTL